MRILSILLASTLLLAGCSKSAAVRESAGGDFLQLQGATLVLNQAVEVGPGKARVFIQDGRVLGNGFDHYRAHCGLEIRSVQHDGFVVQPDRFAITLVQGSLQQVVTRGAVQVASLSLASGIDGGNGSSAYHEGYHFWLESRQQPEVIRLSCYGVYAQPYELEPPTLQEIHEALGPLAEIRG